MSEPTPRLQKALDAGSVAALFPLLADWSPDELRALTSDTEAYCEALQAEVNKAHEELALKPENFFNRKRAALVDERINNKRLEILAMGAEIISVALYYLS